MSLTIKHKASETITSLTLTHGSVDARLISLARCGAAVAGLLFVFAYINPTPPTTFSTLTLSSMVVFGIWSVALAATAFRHDPDIPRPSDSNSGDVLFCVYLVSLAQEANSLFFTFLFLTFFLLAILHVFLSRGFQEVLLVTGASVILFIVMGLWLESAAEYSFDHTLAHPIYFVTLGYMISFRNRELTQFRRMALLQEVNSPLDLRIDYEQGITVNMERIMNFYQASACILVLKCATPTPAYRSYYISNQHNKTAQCCSNRITPINQCPINPHEINEETAKILLSLPTTFSTCHHQKTAWWKRAFSGYPTPTTDSSLDNSCRAIADLLDTQCFLTAPHILSDGSVCRIYLIPQRQSLAQSDTEFLAQLLRSISKIIENKQLMDKIASESGKHERFKISLDIHDTTIQPYIGLKLGLDALNRQAGADNPLSKNIRELLSMTETTISDLRQYVTTLRANKMLAGDSLAKSINEQADRFKHFYGIDVEVKYDSDLRLNSLLTSAVCHIIAEGLSNIMRHTQTKHAYISVGCENKNLQLEIGNKSSGENEHFTPRSIDERARSLGGTSIVKCNPKGYTVVHISIPLHCNPCYS